MGSNRPAAPGRLSRLTRLLVVLSAAACAVRPPILVPPPSGIDGVEGFGSASIAGAEASIKGKFAFLFRRPGLGRVEAVDPIGRTAFVIHFRGGRAWFVLPRKKVYTEAPDWYGIPVICFQLLLRSLFVQHRAKVYTTHAGNSN